MGETVHGDYNRLVNDGMLHSATNYECYKGIHSAINSLNLFEIVHSLLRQFGPEEWTLYKGKHMLSFVDNHDVSRIASVINNEKIFHLHMHLSLVCRVFLAYTTEVNGASKPISHRETLR